MHFFNIEKCWSHQSTALLPTVQALSFTVKVKVNVLLSSRCRWFDPNSLSVNKPTSPTSCGMSTSSGSVDRQISHPSGSLFIFGFTPVFGQGSQQVIILLSLYRGAWGKWGGGVSVVENRMCWWVVCQYDNVTYYSACFLKRDIY